MAAGMVETTVSAFSDKMAPNFDFSHRGESLPLYYNISETVPSILMVNIQLKRYTYSDKQMVQYACMNKMHTQFF